MKFPLIGYVLGKEGNQLFIKVILSIYHKSGEIVRVKSNKLNLDIGDLVLIYAKAKRKMLIFNVYELEAHEVLRIESFKDLEKHNIQINNLKNEIIKNIQFLSP